MSSPSVSLLFSLFVLFFHGDIAFCFALFCFHGSWLVVFLKVLQSGFIWLFSHDQVHGKIFGRNIPSGKLWAAGRITLRSTYFVPTLARLSLTMWLTGVHQISPSEREFHFSIFSEQGSAGWYSKVLWLPYSPTTCHLMMSTFIHDFCLDQLWYWELQNPNCLNP